MLKSAVFCTRSCGREGVFWCSVHCVLGGHFPLFLVFIYPTILLIVWENWTSHLHNAFVTERLKHLFNIVIQLDIRRERLFDPGFGLLGGGFSNIMN